MDNGHEKFISFIKRKGVNNNLKRFYFVKFFITEMNMKQSCFRLGN